MEKMYNGAVMALPEKDEDLFRQINAKTAQRRAEQEAEAREMYLYSDAMPEEEDHQMDLRKVLPWVAAVLLSVLSLLLGRMM